MSKAKIRFIDIKNALKSQISHINQIDNKLVYGLTQYFPSSLKSFFNFRFYFSNKFNPANKLHNFFYKKYIENKTHNISKDHIQELFEYKDKAIYFTASLVCRDITELNSVDNYKENFPYTVRLIKINYYHLTTL